MVIKVRIRMETLREMIKPKHKYRIVTVDSVILKENKVLLLKRSFGMFKGHWVLPGGKVTKGEDTWKAVVREAREETGLDVRVVRMIGFYDSPDRDPEKHAASMAFLCRPLKGKLKGNTESTDIRYFPVEELPEKMGFDHRKIIQDTLRSINYKKNKSVAG
jgi:8-oxo-dGTP diphosphatase